MKLPEKKPRQKKEPKPKEQFTPDALEALCGADDSALLEAFKGRANAESARLIDATDSEFWIAVCFQTREQKEEFLKKAGLWQLGDKYLDGTKVAKAMGIKLESPVPPNRRVAKFGGAYLDRIIQ